MTRSPENWCSAAPPQPPPPGPTPQERGISVSSLCSLGWQPILITGLVRNFLTLHFSDPSQIETPDLASLLWRPDERTGILIESIYRWRSSLVEKRPAIIIKRNTMQNLALGLNNDRGTDGNGNRVYSTFWLGSHTLFCLHGTGAGAEILASEVLGRLVKFAPTIIQYLNLFKWQVTDYGAISEVEEAREGFAVPITIGWCYEQSWVLELESPRLRKIPLGVLLDGALLDGTN